MALDRDPSTRIVALFAILSAPACSDRARSKDACSTASALRACAGPSVVHGVDVSTYQGTIDWARVRSGGFDFAFARISDGTKFPDAEFASNWAGMKRAGLIRGCYQYFRAGENPLSQANLVASLLNDAGGLQPGDLPVVMDLETADGQSAPTIEANVKTWLDSIQARTGRAPIIYTSPATCPVASSAFATYTLWVAHWDTSCPTTPNGWSRWKFWQYSDMGLASGIAGAVDLDEFDGTLPELLSFASFSVASSAGSVPPDASADGNGVGPPDSGGAVMAGSSMGGGLADGSSAGQPCAR